MGQSIRALMLLSSLGALACGSETTAQPGAKPISAELAKAIETGDDQSRCEWKGRNDREITESSGPGAIQPNVRRVYRIVGDGEDRRRVLACREVDSNLDGVKDLVRKYDEKGEVNEEQADSDYNGRIDTWTKFAGGRVAKVEFDRNDDGQPDETRYYIKGKLSRVQRDSNSDGKPDVWEIYGDGRLQRMGVDLDFDGRVDRWDRDEVARRLAEQKEKEEEEQKEREEEAKKKAEEGEDGEPVEGYVSPRKR